MTRTTPFLRITLQLRHIFFTDACTFMVLSCSAPVRPVSNWPGYFARKTIRALVKSYGVNSTVTLSPGRMRM